MTSVVVLFFVYMRIYGSNFRSLLYPYRSEALDLSGALDFSVVEMNDAKSQDSSFVARCKSSIPLQE